MRLPRIVMVIGWVGILLSTAAVSLVPMAGQGSSAQAAPAALPLQQGVNVSGIVTSGQGTCFPDAVLIDCNGTATHQLRGPAGSGFFTPYYNQWVDISGAVAQCAAGDDYVNVVSINPGTNPCGPQQPTATTAPGQPTATPVPGQPTVTPIATAPISGNLATGRSVFASSTQSSHPPEHAVDGDLNTWWASLPGRDPYLAAQNRQWIYVDLGSPQQVTDFNLTWGDQYYARGYGIYVWGDWCRGWCHLGSTSYGDGGLDDWQTNGPGVEGQYFMFYLINPAYIGWHYELKEIEILGAGAVPAGSTNVASGKASVALSQEAGYPAGNATDGDLVTEWRTAANGVPTWLYVDLGTTMMVDRAVLRWSPGLHATDYTLYSWNGRNWVAMHTQRSGQGGDETASFWAVQTRYVLLYANAGASSQVGLRELEVYERSSSGGGGGGGNPPPPNPPRPPTPFLFEGRLDAASGRLAARPQVMPRGLDLPAIGQIQQDLEQFGTDVFDAVDGLGLPIPGSATE